ncbi:MULTISPECIES: hypothetical protein [unclassified Bradyrhizobium]|nr:MULTISPECIES: hypothetical protein [unclassified Bradyrhizobium]MDA9407810.1 hypothetical protein [Bradyrhizobium sp. CCBAU 45384]MDA9439098.1 hypothetical protein [Bradyrhizobium sp. CCBAU 51745]
MKVSRITLLALAAAASLGLAAPASATDWSWLSNKDYIACLQLYAYGNFQMPPNLSPAQQAAYHEKGRQFCNRTYYGHN